MIVTEPFSKIVTIIHVGSNYVKAIAKRLITLVALRLLLAWIRLLVKFKYLYLILKLLLKEDF